MNFDSAHREHMTATTQALNSGDKTPGHLQHLQVVILLLLIDGDTYECVCVNHFHPLEMRSLEKEECSSQDL